MRDLLSHCFAILPPGVKCFVFFFFSCNCIVSFGEVPCEVPSVPQKTASFLQAMIWKESFFLISFPVLLMSTCWEFCGVSKREYKFCSPCLSFPEILYSHSHPNKAFSKFQLTSFCLLMLFGVYNLFFSQVSQCSSSNFSYKLCCVSLYFRLLDCFVILTCVKRSQDIVVEICCQDRGILSIGSSGAKKCVFGLKMTMYVVSFLLVFISTNKRKE